MSLTSSCPLLEKLPKQLQELNEVAGELEKAAHIEEKLQVLEKLFQLDVHVSDLLLSPVGKTVRGLAGEGGEVGGKALALLESWKQLVMTAGGAETLTPTEPEAWDEGPVEPEIIIGPGPEQC